MFYVGQYLSMFGLSAWFTDGTGIKLETAYK